MLAWDEINAFDIHILQHHIKEPDQHILVGLAAEHPLEHEVTQQICVCLFLAFRLLLFFCLSMRIKIKVSPAKFGIRNRTMFKIKKNNTLWILKFRHFVPNRGLSSHFSFLKKLLEALTLEVIPYQFLFPPYRDTHLWDEKSASPLETMGNAPFQ